MVDVIAAAEHVDALDHLAGQAAAELAALRDALAALSAARAAARQRAGGACTELEVLVGVLGKAASRLGRVLADAEACGAEAVRAPLAAVVETVDALQATAAMAPDVDVEQAHVVVAQEAGFLCHTLAALAVHAVGLAEAAGVRFGVELASTTLAPLVLPTALAALCDARAAGEEASLFTSRAWAIGGSGSLRDVAGDVPPESARTLAIADAVVTYQAEQAAKGVKVTFAQAFKHVTRAVRS